jgi:hypothetical protein
MSMIPIDRHPSARTLRQFGLIWLGFVTVLGGIAWWKDLHGVAAVLWVLAVVVPVIGWWQLRFMRLVFLGMSYLAWPIGMVVSHVLLAAVYYLVLTPIGLVLRVVGYDPMHRRFDPEAPSYWVERDTGNEASSPKRYFRQF